MVHPFSHHATRPQQTSTAQRDPSRRILLLLHWACRAPATPPTIQPQKIISLSETPIIHTHPPEEAFDAKRSIFSWLMQRMLLFGFIHVAYPNPMLLMKLLSPPTQLKCRRRRVQKLAEKCTTKARIHHVAKTLCLLSHVDINRRVMAS